MYTEFITPAELTGYGRAALADRPENQFVLSQWLGYQAVNDLEFRFSRGGGGLLEAAEYRAYNAEPGFGSREGISRVSGELPPIGQQYVLTEYDTLRLRANPGQEIRDLLLRDAERIARQIDTRLEFARADALVTGSVSINERGVIATVDFARSSAHSVAAGTVWSDLDDSLPLDDLQSWVATYVDTNGVPPGVTMMSTKVRNYLLRNEQVIGMAVPLASTGAVGQIPVDALNGLLSSFDIPPIVINDARARRRVTATNTSETGLVTSQRFIPDDKVLLLPPPGDNSLGSTMWGTTAEAQEPEYGVGAGELPGLVVGAFKQKETPVHVVTIGSAIAIPILVEPDLTFVADVLA
jgi:hypothetical protein